MLERGTKPLTFDGVRGTKCPDLGISVPTSAPKRPPGGVNRPHPGIWRQLGAFGESGAPILEPRPQHRWRLAVRECRPAVGPAPAGDGASAGFGDAPVAAPRRSWFVVASVAKCGSTSLLARVGAVERRRFRKTLVDLWLFCVTIGKLDSGENHAVPAPVTVST